jgi:hypothetical protein
MVGESGRRICNVVRGWNGGVEPRLVARFSSLPVAACCRAELGAEWRLVVLTERHWAGMAEAPGARPYGRGQANRDGQLSDANHGQALDRPAALRDR